VERGAGPTAIFDRLRVEHSDFPGSLSAVKRLVLRLKRERGVRPEDVTIPVETEPGEVAYVDFGYAGKRYDQERGVLRKSWVFVMVLGHSRHMVAYLSFDQKIETWLRLHVRAFQDLGGVPHVIVPEYVACHIFWLLLPLHLCGRVVTGRPHAGHRGKV